MILLRNFDIANKYFDYDGQCEKEYDFIVEINGWYKMINNLFSGLLVHDNNLYFLLGMRKYLINNRFRIVTEFTKDNATKTILFDEDEQIMSFLEYPSDNSLNISPFEYLDQKDFEWSGFIKKIINDENRKKTFIANLTPPN